MKLTTTLNKIRSHHPYSNGLKELNKTLGLDFNPEQEINLLTVLESNGVQDMLWCLRTTNEDSLLTTKHLAIEFALQALPIFEKQYPDDKRLRVALQGAKDYLEGKISKVELQELVKDAYAAASTAYTAAYAASTAYTAAYAADAAAYAADAAADATAYAAAADAAAYAAAADAAADATDQEEQVKIIKKYLSW